MSSDDRVAIRALVASMGGRHPVWCRHFIYVSDQAKAGALAAKLRLEGFAVESRMGADEVNWLVLARHKLVRDEEAIEAVGQTLTELAEAFGGEYDGWEGEVAED